LRGGGGLDWLRRISPSSVQSLSHLAPLSQLFLFPSHPSCVYRLHLFKCLRRVKRTWRNAPFASQAQATHGSTQTHGRDARWHTLSHTLTHAHTTWVCAHGSLLLLHYAKWSGKYFDLHRHNLSSPQTQCVTDKYPEEEGARRGGVNWTRTDSECHLAGRFQEQSASVDSHGGLHLHQQLSLAGAPRDPGVSRASLRVQSAPVTLFPDT